MPPIKLFHLALLVSLPLGPAAARTATDEPAYRQRAEAVEKLVRAEPMDWTAARGAAEGFLRDCPDRFESNLCMMVLAWNAELAGKRELERTLASEMSRHEGPPSSETPEWAGNPVAWAKGALHRLDLLDRPLTIRFTSIDGRTVDLASLRGKVVLVDFWATWCPPCVAAVPALKAVYDRYHAQGFEVLGISWDQDRSRLTTFTREHAMPWPQYWDGARRSLGLTFGIGGIPYVFLIDSRGNLRAATANPEQLIKSGIVPALLAEARSGH